MLYESLFDVSKPLTTHYGAIRGLTVLGSQVLETYLLPNLRQYYQLLQPNLNNIVTRTEAQKCYDALLVIFILLPFFVCF